MEGCIGNDKTKSVMINAWRNFSNERRSPRTLNIVISMKNFRLTQNKKENKIESSPLFQRVETNLISCNIFSCYQQLISHYQVQAIITLHNMPCLSQQTKHTASQTNTNMIQQNLVRKKLHNEITTHTERKNGENVNLKLEFLFWGLVICAI